MKIRACLPLLLFDLFSIKSNNARERKQKRKILKFHSNYYKLLKFFVLNRRENAFNVYDTCLSLWKLDFHFLFRFSSIKRDFMIIEKNIGNPFDFAVIAGDVAKRIESELLASRSL
jgi:hypothetical protein